MKANKHSAQYLLRTYFLTPRVLSHFLETWFTMFVPETVILTRKLSMENPNDDWRL